MKGEHNRPKCHQYFRAVCLDCNWSNSTRNAHPSARHHALVHPNHRVNVEWHFHYNPMMYLDKELV